MSRIGGEPVKSPTRELYEVVGRLIGIAGPGISRKAGQGFTATRTGTGVYVVTPDINYPYLAGGGAVVMSSANPLEARVTAYTINGGSGTVASVTFTVFNTTTGTATDLGTTEELWFQIGFSRSVTP